MRQTGIVKPFLPKSHFTIVSVDPFPVLSTRIQQKEASKADMQQKVLMRM